MKILGFFMFFVFLQTILNQGKLLTDDEAQLQQDE